MALSQKQIWDVYTGSSGNERSGSDVFLGTFTGFLDEIALTLADKQSGFWCDGTLTFRKHEPKNELKLPRKTKRKTVNVIVEGQDWVSAANFRNAKKFFAGRPVIVRECNLYGAVTIGKSALDFEAKS